MNYIERLRAANRKLIYDNKYEDFAALIESGTYDDIDIFSMYQRIKELETLDGQVLYRLHKIVDEMENEK